MKAAALLCHKGTLVPLLAYLAAEALPIVTFAPTIPVAEALSLKDVEWLAVPDASRLWELLKGERVQRVLTGTALQTAPGIALFLLEIGSHKS